MKKKILALVLATAMTLSLAACGGNSGESSDAPVAKTTEDTTQTETSGDDTQAAEADTAADPTNGEVVDGKFVETRKITVEVYDRGNDGGSDPTNNMYTEYIKKGMLEDHNVEVEFVAVPRWTEVEQINNLLAAGDAPDVCYTYDYPTIQTYANMGGVLDLGQYVDTYKDLLPNLWDWLGETNIYWDKDPANGTIWALEGKLAVSNRINTFVRKDWLDKLGLKEPTTKQEFEDMLIAFRDNAASIKAEYGIDGDIIPMSCIVNNGDQDPSILINGFGEGYGDADKDRHIAVTNDRKVICAATQQGYRDGLDWLHKLYAEKLIDPECFTQEWSTYVSKGKAGRYGVCFSWDVANIDNLTDWEPLPALTADTRNITPQNGSFTSGFARGRCVVTAKAANPALVCAWLDQMYAPLQSPQNNWGTYGDAEGFNIFELSTNDKGEPMLKHAPLGDASPVEVREAQCVGGPLAVLDDYYGVYVTCPDDAQYRLDWIKEIYTPDMNNDYVYPNVFMSNEDTEQVSNLQADLQTYMNTQKANWIMNGTTDAEWNEYLSKLEAYGLSDYLGIMQKYLDAYYA